MPWGSASPADYWGQLTVLLVLALMVLVAGGAAGMLMARRQPDKDGPAVAEADLELARDLRAQQAEGLELGRIAQACATNDELRRIGSMLVEEQAHGSGLLDGWLAAWSEEEARSVVNGIPRTGSPSAVHDRLSRVPPRNFEHAFRQLAFRYWQDSAELADSVAATAESEFLAGLARAVAESSRRQLRWNRRRGPVEPERINRR